ncbi:hypothetical protein K466DRAFT_193162 [Polyporus arcularius HHB13444]|uniref:Uncharacterized protein n=1 Tax=Polyporus arcularius HHB13444 TaxID=1314778 RepID=A0A5C3PYH8_9APHY|nr:hypothetical protein K466DRAFT_193162 [Polyporus arcularius HHB13444]
MFVSYRKKGLLINVLYTAQLRAQPTPSQRHSFVLHVPPAGHRPPLVPNSFPATAEPQDSHHITRPGLALSHARPYNAASAPRSPRPPPYVITLNTRDL